MNADRLYELEERYWRLPEPIRAWVDKTKAATILDGVNLRNGGSPEQLAVAEELIAAAERAWEARR